eukprot:903998-Rhodomonas_salina.1
MVSCVVHRMYPEKHNGSFIDQVSWDPCHAPTPQPHSCEVTGVGVFSAGAEGGLLRLDRVGRGPREGF